MKKIRTAALSAFLILCAFTMVTYTACTESPCKNVLCKNNSVCADGKCLCPPGYSGTFCEIKAPCTDVYCINNGYCEDGKCVCPDGYEGFSCQLESRVKFFKKWSCRDTASGAGAVPRYTSEMKAGSGLYDLTISNFSNSFFTNPVKGTLHTNIITIAAQTPDVGGYSIYGTGKYDTTGKKISWTYVMLDPSGVPSTFTGTWE